MNTPLRSEEIQRASEYLIASGCVNKTDIQSVTGLYPEVPNLYIKREDQQPVKSFKIRGALNAMSLLSPEERDKGVVCASAGNHAQGIAVACSYFQTRGTIFMPKGAPDVKVQATKEFGGEYIDIRLIGDNFDETKQASEAFTLESRGTYIHPFDDTGVMIGASTIGYEIFQQMKEIGQKVDYVVVPVGGGGLLGGIISAKNLFSPDTTIIGSEPTGHASMKKSLQKGRISEVSNPNSSKFADGTAVARVGDKTFEIVKQDETHIIDVRKDRLGTYLKNMRDIHGIELEPSGALSLAAIGQEIGTFKNKVVVAITSGANIDNGRKELIDFLADRHRLYREGQGKQSL